MPTQDGKGNMSDDRWLLGAICFVTVAGIVGLGMVLYAPRSDAATLAVMAGFVGAALAGLVAALKGQQLIQKLDKVDEPIQRIDHAVNGNLTSRLDAQDKQIEEIRTLLASGKGQ